MTIFAISLKRSAVFLCVCAVLFVASAFFSQTYAQQSTGTSSSVSGEIARSVPQSGGRGQYVTLMGRALGTVPGTVSFVQSGKEALADTQFPQACQQVWWRDASIIIKVPQDTKTGLNKIKIKRADGTLIKELDFTVTAGVAPPGICALTPDNGPSGIAMRIFGEQFGTAKGRVTFGTVEVQVAENGWHDREIVLASTPSFSGSQSTVRVVRSDNTLTNPALFTQGACRANQCGAGNSCCSDGSCRPLGACEQTTVAQCTYSWSFSTGFLKGLGASCKQNAECFSLACGADGRCIQGTAALGQACSFDQQCTVGGLCINGICSPTLKAIGESCKDVTECQSNRCVQGVCAPGTKKLGEACAGGDECSTLRCVAGQCAQQPRCLSVEKIEPQGRAIRQNSVFSVTFNQMVDQESVRKNVTLNPVVKGTFEFQTMGEGNAAKTVARFSPSSLLSRQQKYALVVGKDVKSASSENTIGKCVDTGGVVCTGSGEICTAPNSICTNGARCSGHDSLCSGAGTRCTGTGAVCVDGADCSRRNRAIQQGCSLADAGHTIQGDTRIVRGRTIDAVFIFVSDFFSSMATRATEIAESLSNALFGRVFAAGIADAQPRITAIDKDSEGRITLRWVLSGATADGFEVYRLKDSVTWPAQPAIVGSTGGNIFTYTDSGDNEQGLPLGTYRYKVRAFGVIIAPPHCGDGVIQSNEGEQCDDGNDENNDICSNICRRNQNPVETQPQQKPAAPTGLAAASVTAAEIALAWTDASTDETLFILERSGDGTTFAPLRILGPNTTTYVDSGLARYTHYWYRVASANTAGPSEFSNTVDARTRVITICFKSVPGVPELASAQALSASQIQLFWNDASNNEHAFIVERSTDGSTYSPIVALGEGAATYIDTNLVASTKYWYRIKAHNCKGDSGASNARDTTTYTPDDGMGAGARCGDGIIQLSRGEQCDNGTNASTQTCTGTCTLPACGAQGQCPETMKCDTQDTTLCRPVCQTNTNCQSPLVCNAARGMCIPPPGDGGGEGGGTIPPGGACTLNTQCTTGLCVNAQCTQNNPPGTPCTQQYECSSNRCVNGVCAAPLPP
ncbi:DUF4215 domain-containing protein, partial [Candidatus Uhrbacteria bacterium]|nr:DUF4215 domain-containing protein [Candidatus Uhrbacteria bacterium]